MTIVAQYAVPVEGVGRRDYSVLVESSVAFYVGTTLRQAEFSIYGTYILPPWPFPFGYAVVLGLAQPDGSAWYEAGEMPHHFYQVGMSVDTNYLVGVGLYRYASLNDWFAGIVAERFAVKFGYGSVDVIFTRGIRTQVGSAYALFAGCWLPDPTFTLTIRGNGLVTELTPVWMG